VVVLVRFMELYAVRGCGGPRLALPASTQSLAEEKNRKGAKGTSGLGQIAC